MRRDLRETRRGSPTPRRWPGGRRGLLQASFHPIAFESRKLTRPERSYPPHLLELPAVVRALKALRPNLLD